MISEPRFRLGRRTSWLLIAALLLVLLVLLNLPIADFVRRFDHHRIVDIVLRRRMPLFGIGLVVAVALAVWLALRRQFRALTAWVAIAGTALLACLVYEFQVRYPHADVFSGQRFGDGLAVVLGTDTLLSRFEPVSTLKLERQRIERAAFPAIDVHFHLESLPPDIDADRLVRAMDAAGVAQIVHLGGAEDVFEHFAQAFYAKHPDRIILFAKPNPGVLARENGVARDLEWIKKAARMGARGLKENKSYGMSQRDMAGKIVPVDDPRMGPIWDLAGKLGMPVLVHTGEPPSFWDPVDARNERYPELLKYPERTLYGTDVPSRAELRKQRERLLARHPGTNFIGAHLGMDPDDLAYVAHLLDTYPNYYVDMSSVVQELGREPYSARRFFIRYQDRILFGTDGGYGLQASGEGWTAERLYRSYFEFLETENEYIEYPLADVTKQGTWRVYGIHLPADVLEKVYVRNAQKLIPSHEEIMKRLAELN
jgi:uncharacterized protein